MPGSDLDTEVLHDFIYALNITRRQVLAYPPGHPMVATATERLLTLLPRLLEFRPEVTIGIARNLLLIDGQPLDAANPVYRDLAVTLFDARVASLTVRRELSAAELRSFLTLLRDDSRRLAAAGLSGIEVGLIDYGAFHATEADAVRAPRLAAGGDEPALLWKAFAAGMVEGNLDADGVRALPATDLAPEALAELMNRQYAAGSVAVVDYERAITDFLKQADRRQVTPEAHRESSERLGRLVDRLSPELRRRLLNSTLKEVSRSPEEAEAMLSGWSQKTLLDTLEQADVGELQVPRTMLDIIARLARHRPAGSKRGTVVGPRSQSGDDAARLVELLFRDGESSRFVPADHADALALLAAADAPCPLDRTEADRLLATMGGHAVEQQFSTVMLALLEQGVGPRSVDAIARNFRELIGYFLETGDFATLNLIHEAMARHCDQGRLQDDALLQDLDADELVNQVLDGFDPAAREQNAAVRALIGRIGRPLVAPLVDRLAEEENMSRRRFLMECLQAIGPRALDDLCGQLGDGRWYVVRNVVAVLREIDDPRVLPELRRLLGHPHPKVQAELTRALLHLQDPRAEEAVLRDLESRDLAVLANAVRLAAGSGSAQIACRLAELLNDRGNSEAELSLKSLIVKVLADKGLGDTLDELADFIESRVLFPPPALTRVKIEALASLPRYADPYAAQIVDRVARKGSGELASAATQLRQQFRGVAS